VRHFDAPPWFIGMGNALLLISHRISGFLLNDVPTGKDNDDAQEILVRFDNRHAHRKFGLGRRKRAASRCPEFLRHISLRTGAEFV